MGFFSEVKKNIWKFSPCSSSPFFLSELTWIQNRIIVLLRIVYSNPKDIYLIETDNKCLVYGRSVFPYALHQHHFLPTSSSSSAWRLTYFSTREAFPWCRSSEPEVRLNAWTILEVTEVTETTYSATFNVTNDQRRLITQNNVTPGDKTTSKDINKLQEHLNH